LRGFFTRSNLKTAFIFLNEFWPHFFLDKKVSKKSRLPKIFLKIFILQAGDLSASRDAKIVFTQAKLLLKNKDFLNVKF